MNNSDKNIKDKSLDKQLEFSIEEHVEKGYRYLLESLSSGPDYNEEALMALLDITESPPLTPDITNLQHHFNISNKVMSHFKTVANNMMLDKKAEQAAEVYYCITLLNPHNAESWLLLGNCHYHLHRYEEAIISYAAASIENPSDPQPLVWTAHCLEALKDKDNALIYLASAVELIGKHPKYASLREGVEEYKAHLLK